MPGRIISGSVVGGTALGGASIAAFTPIFLAGLNPGTTIAAKPLHLAVNQESVDGLLTGVATSAETTGNSNFYYNKEKQDYVG